MYLHDLDVSLKDFCFSRSSCQWRRSLIDCVPLEICEASYGICYSYTRTFERGSFFYRRFQRPTCIFHCIISSKIFCDMNDRFFEHNACQVRSKLQWQFFNFSRPHLRVDSGQCFSKFLNIKLPLINSSLNDFISFFAYEHTVKNFDKLFNFVLCYK